MADTSLIEIKIGLLIWKTSNLWQSNLRKILIHHNISLNEYLILQSISLLVEKKFDIYQTEIADYVGIDISVASVTLKLLEKKMYIRRLFKSDNRKKIIKILKKGEDLFKIIHPLIQLEEHRMFKKLNEENFNFTNSLKLLLGKKIRIKAEKEYQ